MPIEITVPRQGWSMEEGVFVEWRKRAGERVSPGDPLYLLESEKATEEIEALDAGILSIPHDAPKPGDKVVVGQLLAYLLAEGEKAPSAVHAGGEVGRFAKPSYEPSPKMEVGRFSKPSYGVEERTAEGPAARRRARATAVQPMARAPAEKTISPRARRVAAELGVDWRGLNGSGRTGRIRERDVRAAVTGSAEACLLPHTNIRRTIAKRMLAGVNEAAPVTLTAKVDATNLVNLRKQFQAAEPAQDTVLPGYTDMILKLVAAALRQHPMLQAQWREEGLLVPNHIDIAFAVDTDAGLLVPVVRGVDRLSLREVAAATRSLAEQARAGKLSVEQMRKATFTITNLGGFGIDAFTPIIHLPQCAVLGVGRIVRKPAVFNEQIVPRDMVTLSLTFDHRVVDGAPAARFLQNLCGCIEQPAAWLIT